MSYKYKLSRRLAQIFYFFPALAITFLFAACGGGDPKSSFGPAIDTTISSIVVTPEKTIAKVGDTVHIEAYGSSETVHNAPVELDWKSSGGLITPAGDFRADVPGIYQVSGWTRNEARVADTVSLTVEAVQVLGSTGCTNEPAGYAKLSDNPWNNVPLPYPSVDGFGWSSRVSDMFRLQVQNDPTAPRSGGSVLAGLFQQGAQGGGAPFKMEQRFDRNVTGIYMCMWHKLDPNFTNNGNSATKFGFFLTPYSFGSVTKAVNHYFNLTDYLGIRLQSTGAALNRNVMSTFNMMNHRGEWHKIEWLVVANTVGKADGVARIWVDGSKVLEATGVRYFYANQEPAFNGVTWNPTYGGGRNPVPYDMYQWIDHWYVSAR